MKKLLFIFILNFILGIIFLDKPETVSASYPIIFNNIEDTNVTSAVYFPGWNLITRTRIDTVISFCVENNLNAIIADVKNVKGELFFRSENEIANFVHSTAHTVNGVLKTIDFDYLYKEAKKRNIRIIGRFVMFRDEKVFDNFPGYRLESKEKWIDFRISDVMDYTLDLLEEASKLPIDELALDYIRFPDVHGFGSLTEKVNRITEIVAKASKIVNEADINLGIFVFGWVAWDLKQNIGQSIPYLVPYVDVIYPMLYPSHFNLGSLGFTNPSDHPYEIIKQGYLAATKLSMGKPVIPMLQIFWYTPTQILEQLKAVYFNDMPGYGCWNAAGNYELLSQALKIFKRQSEKRSRELKY